MLKIDIKKKAKVCFKTIPIFLAKRAFYVFIFFVFLVILVSLLLLYLYLWRVEKKEIKISPKEVEINQEIFEKFLEYYKTKEQNFKNALEEEYIDIFFR